MGTLGTMTSRSSCVPVQTGPALKEATIFITSSQRPVMTVAETCIRVSAGRGLMTNIRLQISNCRRAIGISHCCIRRIIYERHNGLASANDDSNEAVAGADFANGSSRLCTRAERQPEL